MLGDMRVSKAVRLAVQCSADKLFVRGPANGQPPAIPINGRLVPRRSIRPNTYLPPSPATSFELAATMSAARDKAMQRAAPQVSAPPQPPQRERRKRQVARSPRAKQVPCLLQPIDLEIGLQQGELDHVVLRAATAYALAFLGQRCKHLVGTWPSSACSPITAVTNINVAAELRSLRPISRITRPSWVRNLRGARLAPLNRLACA